MRLPSKQISASKHSSKARKRKPHSAAKQKLTPTPVLACLYDIPVISKLVPKKIELEAAVRNQLSPTMQFIALAKARTCDPKVVHSDDPYCAARDAALAAIEQAVSSNNTLNTTFRVWPVASDAHLTTEPPLFTQTEAGDDYLHSYLYEEDLTGLLIEVTDTRIHHPIVGGASLDKLELALPGFKKLLYQILDSVNQTCMPIITPRLLLQDLIQSSVLFNNGSTDIDDLNDYKFASALADEYGDSDFIEKYDLKNASPAELVLACEVEYGLLLPSVLFECFGQSINDPRLWGDFSGTHSNDGVQASIANLLEQAELRTWCDQRPKLIQMLRLLHRIYSLLNEGARFAAMANHMHNPSDRAFHISGESEDTLFMRLLDDAAQDAQNSGDTLDCLGYITLSCDSAESAAQQLSSIHKGSLVVSTTHQLLHMIGY